MLACMYATTYIMSKQIASNPDYDPTAFQYVGGSPELVCKCQCVVFPQLEGNGRYWCSDRGAPDPSPEPTTSSPGPIPSPSSPQPAASPSPTPSYPSTCDASGSCQQPSDKTYQSCCQLGRTSASSGAYVRLRWLYPTGLLPAVSRFTLQNLQSDQGGLYYNNVDVNPQTGAVASNPAATAQLTVVGQQTQFTVTTSWAVKDSYKYELDMKAYMVQGSQPDQTSIWSTCGYSSVVEVLGSNLPVLA
ncbi:hypothetical protein N2152v2_009997 [Parachlorella kessleri]